MERHSLVLLLAFACSSILILFENIQDASIYATSLNTFDVNSTEIPKQFIFYNESNLEIPLSRSLNNLLTIPVQFSPEKPVYNLILDSTNNNENYFYDIMIPCCNSKYASNATCITTCSNIISCNDGLLDCSKFIVILEKGENFYFSFKALELKNQTLTFFGNTITNQTIDLVYSEHDFWKGTDGSFGISYSKNVNSFQSYLAAFYPSQRFALDINKISSKLILGNQLNNHEVIWSEPQARATEWYQNIVRNGFEHQFTLYNLSVCDHFLLSNYSFTWEAKVNTLEQGLRVPQEIYHNIISWFNNTDFDENTVLPSLQFSLENHGQVLSIPLSSLYDKKEKKLHLSSNGNIKYHYYKGGLMSLEPRIEFGVLVLEQFLTFFDMKEMKVGFVQKNYQNSNSFCKKEVKCRGDQEYYGGSNFCLDPICPLFKSVDDSTKTCSFKVEFYIIFGIILGILVTYELVIYFLYQRVSFNLFQR